MIKNKIQIGLIPVEIITVHGFGTIRTPQHKQTKAIYDMIQKRMLTQVGVNMEGKQDITYYERSNCIMERFPGKNEKEIMEIIENDIKDKDKIVDEVKKKAVEDIKNKGKK